MTSNSPIPCIGCGATTTDSEELCDDCQELKRSTERAFVDDVKRYIRNTDLTPARAIELIEEEVTDDGN